MTRFMVGAVLSLVACQGKLVEETRALDGPAAADGGTDATTCALPTTTSAYHLIARRNIASPLPDTTGIAPDGRLLWVIAGGHNAPHHTLVRFDPDSGDQDRSFGFDGLIETPGTGVYGITSDGSAIWISVSGTTNKLVRVDPTSGAITKTMSSPTDLGPSDLDFDGADLLLSSGTGLVFVIDRTTGGIKRQFSPMVTSNRDHGIAFRPGELWVGALFGGLAVHSAATDAYLGEAVNEDGSPISSPEVGSSCFVGPQLVIASDRGITYYDVTTVTSPCGVSAATQDAGR